MIDVYQFYNRPEKELADLLWFWHTSPDEVYSIVRVDEDSANHLYGVTLNPLTITRVQTSPGTFAVKVQVHSIDDASYGVWFPEEFAEEEKFQRLVSKIKWYVGEVRFALNCQEFVYYCMNIGGESVDYN